MFGKVAIGGGHEFGNVWPGDVAWDRSVGSVAVGNIPDKEAVADFGGAAGEEVNGGTGDGSTIVAENRVGDEDGIVSVAAVLDGNAASAWAGEIIGDSQVLENGVRAAENLDSATVGEKRE